MLKLIKETMSKELKESMRTVSRQSENINKDKFIFKKYKIEIINLI